MLLAFKGAAILSEGDLIDALATARPGERVRLTVQRGSSRIPLTVKLGTQPSEAPSQ